MQRQRDAETVCENKNVGIVGQKKNVGHIVGILEKCRNCRTSVSPANGFEDFSVCFNLTSEL